MIHKTMTFLFCLALAAGVFGVLPAPIALANVCTSNGSGNWSTLSWSGCTPGAGDDVVIATGHSVTLDVDVEVRGIAINSGGVFNNGSKTLTANGGYLTNNGTYNGDTGTYSFTAAGGVYGSSGTTFNNATISAGVDFKDGSNPTTAINGTLTINSGGSVANDPPIYGSSSTLKYNSGGGYGRSLEWSATSGPGYPANVQISSNTTFDLSANGSAARQMSGNLTIDNGSTLGMGTMNDPNHLTVLGDVAINGTLNLSTGTANIFVGGNWSSPGGTGGGTFASNGSFVYFNGGDSQVISGSPSGSSRRFERIIVQNNSTVTFNNNVGVESGLEVSAGSTFQTNGSTNFEQELGDAGPLDCDGTCTFNNLTVRNIDASGSAGSIDVNGNFTISNASSNFTAPGSGVAFTVVGNFTNNITTGSFNANGGTVTFDGSGVQNIGGSGRTDFNTWTVNSGATVVVPSGSTQPRATTVNNSGTLRQTQNVGSSAAVDFLKIRNPGDTADTYRGVEIANGAVDLGSTTVKIHGNQNTSGALGFPVNRWYQIDPTNAGTAGLTFHFLCSELQTGQTPANLKVWRLNGSTWDELGNNSNSGATCSGTGSVTVNSVSLSADEQTYVLKINDPTAVTLAEFYAEQVDDFVRVTWETTSELHNLGFNLYRATSPAGPEMQLNAVLIPSQAPGSTASFTYTWQDRANLVAGQTYHYWLEDVDLGGATTLHGPVSVSYVGPTAVGLDAVQATPTAAAGLPLAGTLLVLLAGLAGGLAVRRSRS